MKQEYFQVKIVFRNFKGMQEQLIISVHVQSS